MIKDKTPKASNNSKTKDGYDEDSHFNTGDHEPHLPAEYYQDRDHPDNENANRMSLTELSSDAEHKGEFKQQTEKYESNTADGIYQK